MKTERVANLQGISLSLASMMMAGKIAPEDLEVLSTTIRRLCEEPHECCEPAPRSEPTHLACGFLRD